MSPVRARVVVEGRVQGVFFRDFTRQRARALGVAGWVRNLSDGRVEALMEGEEEAVRTLLDHVAEGPPHAHVANVDVTHGAYTGEFEDFRIVY
jgi:acylphosphatase